MFLFNTRSIEKICSNKTELYDNKPLKDTPGEVERSVNTRVRPCSTSPIISGGETLSHNRIDSPADFISTVIFKCIVYVKDCITFVFIVFLNFRWFCINIWGHLCGEL